MPDQTATAALDAFLQKANDGEWDVIGEHVQPTVTYNNKSESRDRFIRRFSDPTAGGAVKFRIDSLTSDEATSAVAERQALTTKDAGGSTSEVWDMILLFMEDGKISRFFQIQSDMSRHFREPTVPAFTTKPSTSPLSANELTHAFLNYIHSLNNRRLNTLAPELFAEEVLTEGHWLGVEQIRATFVNFYEPAIVGLEYIVEEIVVDVKKQQLAVKLAIEGVPEDKRVRARFGSDRIRLDELAMYGFTDGKISAVSAVTPPGLLPELPA